MHIIVFWIVFNEPIVYHYPKNAVEYGRTAGRERGGGEGSGSLLHHNEVKLRRRSPTPTGFLVCSVVCLSEARPWVPCGVRGAGAEGRTRARGGWRVEENKSEEK